MSLRNILLITLFASACMYLISEMDQKDISFESDEVSLFELSRSELVLERQPDYMYKLDDSGTYYHIRSAHSNGKKSNIYVYSIPDPASDVAALYSDIYNKKYALRDSIQLSYHEMRTLVENSETFEAYGVALEPDDNSIFSRMEETVWVFLFITVLLFAIRLFYELCRYFYYSIFKSTNYRYLDLFFLLISIAYLYWGLTPEHYCESNISALIQLVLILIPVYFVVQYFKSIQFDKLKMNNRIIIRFLLIFFCSVIFIFLSTEIARFIDFNVFHASELTGLANRSLTGLSLGLALAYALSDFVLVSMRHTLSKSKSEAN